MAKEYAVGVEALFWVEGETREEAIRRAKAKLDSGEIEIEKGELTTLDSRESR